MSNGNSRSTGVILGAALLLLLVLLYFAFGPESTEQTETPPTARTTPAAPESDTPAPRPAPTQADAMRPDTAIPAERSGAQVAGTPAASPPPRGDRIPENRDMPEATRREFEDAAERPIPAHVMNDFENPYVEISDAELDRVKANSDPEMPEHIRQEIEAARNRPMPEDVRQAFENPYVEISEEKLEALRQNGRVGGQ